MRSGLLLLIGALLVPVFAFAAFSRSHAERALIAADLASAGIPAAAASSTAELKLLWYVYANRIDPVFSLDGTDPAALRHALSILRTHEDMFLAHYDAAQRAQLEHALYPWSFLTLLPDVQEAREDLFLDPTDAHAARYQRLLMQLGRAYRADTNALAAGVRTATSTQTTFAFPDQVTTQAQFIASLDTLSSVSVIQSAKAAQRFRCLQHFDDSCPALKTLLAERSDHIAIPDAVSPPDASTHAMDELLHTLNERILPPYSARPLPPLIAMHSDCAPFPQLNVRTWWQTLPEGGQARKASMTNDIYLDIVVPQQNPVYQHAYAAGARLKYQITGHYYLCADAGIDTTHEQAALSLHTLLAEGPLFTGGDALSTLESRIRAMSYIDTHADALYVKAAAARIAADGYTTLTREIGDPQVQRLERIISLWQSGSEHFDEVVREAASENDFLTLFQQRMPPFMVFLSRSFPSVFFQAGNTSFVPTPVSFASKVQAHPLSLFRMASYNDMRAMGSTTQEILDAVETAFNAERPFILH